MKTDFSDYSGFIQLLSLSKLLNAFKIFCSYFVSVLLKKPFFWGTPITASFELTTHCNLNCFDCPSNFNLISSSRGDMTDVDFKNFLKPLEKNLTFLTMYFQGEPYLHKNLFDFIEYVHLKKIYTSVSTNGHFLDDDNARKTVTSGLNQLIISLDGINQETYAQFRSNGNYNKVVEGIKNIVKWKKNLNSKKPYIVVQVLLLKSNEMYLKDIKKISKNFGVNKVIFKTAQFFDYKNGSFFIPANAQYSRYNKMDDGTYILKHSIRNRCFRLWQSLVITWDGKVLPCCYDRRANNILGNLKTDSLEKILNSNVYNSFRTEVLTNRKNIKICCNCLE